MLETILLYAALVVFIVFLSGGVFTILVGIGEAFSEFVHGLHRHSGRTVGAH